MRDKLLYAGALLFLLVHSSLSLRQACQTAFVNVDTNETYCYVFHLVGLDALEKDGMWIGFSRAAKTLCDVGMIESYAFPLTMLSINSEKEEQVVRAEVDARNELANGFDELIIGASDGHFDDGSDSKYILTKHSLNVLPGSLYMTKNREYIASESESGAPKMYPNILNMWIVCKGRTDDVLDLRNFIPACIACGCEAVLKSDDSGEVFCYKFHLLNESDLQTDAGVQDDFHYGMTFCSRRTVTMDEKRYNLTLLSVNSLREEFFILGEISKRSERRENINDEVLLGATTSGRGDWLDGSDTTYVRTRFDTESLSEGQGLYLVNRPKYYSRPNSDVADLRGGRFVWIICKARSEKRHPRSHLEETRSRDRPLRNGSRDSMDSRIWSVVVTCFVSVFILTFA